MAQRDQARREVDNLRMLGGYGQEEAWKKYKCLRNKCTGMVPRDTVKSTMNFIRRSGDGRSAWKVVNSMHKSNQGEEIRLVEGEQIVREERLVADKFNEHFIEKIENLRARIDESQREDPLSRLIDKKTGLKFSLRGVTELEAMEAH